MGRLIDADELKAVYIPSEIEGFEKMMVPVEVVLQNIDDMPTVDAVEVVRCKDCEYRERYGADIIYCERHSMMTAPDCFCSDGNNEGDIVSNCYDCPMNLDSDAWMR